MIRYHKATKQRPEKPTTFRDHLVTASLWLYVGHKTALLVEIQRVLSTDVGHDVERADATFLNRNGLLVGHVYDVVADQGVRTINQFHGTGTTLTGGWKKIEMLDRTKAGGGGTTDSAIKMASRFGEKPKPAPRNFLAPKT